MFRTARQAVENHFSTFFKGRGDPSLDVPVKRFNAVDYIDKSAEFFDKLHEMFFVTLWSDSSVVRFKFTAIMFVALVVYGITILTPLTFLAFVLMYFYLLFVTAFPFSFFITFALFILVIFLVITIFGLALRRMLKFAVKRLVLFSETFDVGLDVSLIELLNSDMAGLDYTVTIEVVHVAIADVIMGHFAFGSKGYLMIAFSIAYLFMSTALFVAKRVTMAYFKLLQALWVVIVMSAFAPLSFMDLTIKVFSLLISACLNCVTFFRSGPGIVKTFRFVYAWMWIRLLLLLLSAEIFVWKYGPHHKEKKKLKWRKFFNTQLATLTKVIEATNLPSFIRKLPAAFDIESLNATTDLLESLGWPSSEQVTGEKGETAKALGFEEFLIGSMGFEAGMRQLKLFVDRDLMELQAMAEPFMRTEEYKTLKNEIEATSRYFRGDPITFPDLDIDELWVLVGKIYENSQLAPFRLIIKKWEKKYGLGPLWLEKNRKRVKKLSRKNFIKSIGGIENLIELWQKTFPYTPQMVPLSGVSVKNEALPRRKWAADKVRTVVSSPLPSYILSTVFSYLPNHNFQWRSTPIRVGMPLNGASFATILARHSTLDFHAAGDFEAFDSTLTGGMVEFIKQVRKKGFENHKDFEKICWLIDTSYKGVVNGLLGVSSTGGIYTKATGLSTGHASTTADNSLAVVILYLLAWKQLTGLSAHEFKAHNELSNYGDDHFLSWDDLCPPAWNFKNIQAVMDKWGVKLKLESGNPTVKGGLDRLSFLSKHWREPTFSDKAELDSAQVAVPQFVVYHNRERLLGKMVAKPLILTREYRIKRLLSYLDLCAHHKDIYDLAVNTIHRIDGGRTTMKYVVPSYEQVLQNWYNPKSKVHTDEIEGQEELEYSSEPIMIYGSVTLIDHLANFLAILPDVLNPAVFNSGWTTVLYKRLGDRIYWPFDLLRLANTLFTFEQVGNLARRTCYDFLVVGGLKSNFSPELSPGGLILRHWLFMLFRNAPTKSRYGAAWFLTFFTKFSTLAFMINGRVHEEVRRPIPSVWNTFLVWALSFMPDAPFLSFLAAFHVPNLSFVVDQVWTALLKQIFHRVPANFKDVNSALSQMIDDGLKTLIIAPTGSGKSTSFVYNLTQEFNLEFERFVLIQPRRLLVISLTKYLNESYDLDWVPVTHGHPYRPSRYLVMTMAEVFLHMHIVNEKTLFIVDEVHVDEPLYSMGLSSLLKISNNVMGLTATPNDRLSEIFSISLPVRMASVWSIEEQVSSSLMLPSDGFMQAFYALYATKVLAIVDSMPPSMKFLIFVVDKGQAESLSRLVPGSGVAVTSDFKENIPNVRFVIATAVADAGLTIPDVDVVISPNIGREVVPNLKFQMESSIIELSSDTLKQRRGRTGRTNNGLFILVPVKAEPGVIKQSSVLTDGLLAFSAIRSGMPVESLAALQPQAFLNMLYPEKKLKYGRDLDLLIDDMAKVMTGLSKVHGTTVLDDAGLLRVADTSEQAYASLAETLSGDFALRKTASERLAKVVSWCRRIYVMTNKLHAKGKRVEVPNVIAASILAADAMFEMSVQMAGTHSAAKDLLSHWTNKLIESNTETAPLVAWDNKDTSHGYKITQGVNIGNLEIPELLRELGFDVDAALKPPNEVPEQLKKPLSGDEGPSTGSSNAGPSLPSFSFGGPTKGPSESKGFTFKFGK